jgi:DnaJ-class molecular chaperone
MMMKPLVPLWRRLQARAVGAFGTHYEQLEVGEGASFKEVREKYLEMSKRFHPDLCAKAEDRYQDIQRAYKVLIKPQSRKAYDLSLGIHHSPWEKEIIGQKFTSEFQHQALYDELLKSGKEDKSASP